MSGWNPLDTPINAFVLSDFVSPGVCLGPQGAEIKRRLDERKGYGIDWAYLIFTGRDLAEFTMEITIWTRAHWNYWNDVFEPLIAEVPRKGPVSQSSGAYTPGRAHLIWYPTLYKLGITQVVVAAEPVPVTDDKMVTRIPIKFKQVALSPRPAFARPESATAQKPLTGDKAEIQRLQQELESPAQIDKAAS
jgi:hypothetical protein